MGDAKKLGMEVAGGGPSRTDEEGISSRSLDSCGSINTPPFRLLTVCIGRAIVEQHSAHSSASPSLCAARCRRAKSLIPVSRFPAWRLAGFEASGNRRTRAALAYATFKPVQCSESMSRSCCKALQATSAVLKSQGKVLWKARSISVSSPPCERRRVFAIGILWPLPHQSLFSS